jgi:hypothetical protein
MSTWFSKTQSPNLKRSLHPWSLYWKFPPLVNLISLIFLTFLTLKWVFACNSNPSSLPPTFSHVTFPISLLQHQQQQQGASFSSPLFSFLIIYITIACFLFLFLCFYSLWRVSFSTFCCGKYLEMEDVKFGSESTTVGDPVLLHNKISAIRLAGPKKLQVFFNPISLYHNSVSCVAFCISFSIILLCRHCSSCITLNWDSLFKLY